MKKISILLIAILTALLVVGLFAQTNNPIDTLVTDATEVVESITTIAVGISDVGFGYWIQSNWLMFIFAIVGLGRLIVRVTPTKVDDVWYSKYILKPMKAIGKALQLGGK